MNGGGLALSLCILSACGRIGFESDASPSNGDGSAAPLTCGASYAPAAGLTSRYRMSVAPAFWHAAEAECESDNGHLVIINDTTEQAYVRDQYADLDGWLGVTDTFSEGTFRWVDGSPLSSSNFFTGEPNDDNGNEDCVEMYMNGFWNDRICTQGPKLVFMCECDKIPVATGTFCDTSDDTTCGDCSTTCPGGTTCGLQVCINPS